MDDKKLNQNVAFQLYNVLSKNDVINNNISAKDLENFLNNINPILKNIIDETNKKITK